MYTLTIYTLPNSTVFQSSDKEAIWKAIGETWAPYDVRDENGNIAEEFVPF